MNHTTINLIEEWAKQRRAQLRMAQAWTFLTVGSLLGVLIGIGFSVWQVPKAYKERALWQSRAERLQSEPVEASAPPIPTETVRHVHQRNTEFQIVLLAITRLLPRQARLNEAHIEFQNEQGLVITLRGMTQGFEPIKTFTERLRAVQIFSDITPVSVSKEQGEDEVRWSRFEMRITLPASDPAPAQTEEPTEQGGAGA